MSQPINGAPPYKVVYSERCRAAAKDLLSRAISKGRFAELAHVIQDIDTRLKWIPLDFGEPLQDFPNLGLKEHIGVVAPVAVKYCVDEARRIVYVLLPFSLLPNSGL